MSINAPNWVKRATLPSITSPSFKDCNNWSFLAQFGAFIDIGGVDGLVHVSELSHEHVQTPEEVVSIHLKIVIIDLF
jgi:small subunit ribosomal protein S1